MPSQVPPLDDLPQTLDEQPVRLDGAGPTDGAETDEAAPTAVADPTGGAERTVVAEAPDRPTATDRPAVPAPSGEPVTYPRRARETQHDGSPRPGATPIHDRLSRHRQQLIGLLVVALAIAVTAAGFFGYRWQADRSLQAAREAALAAAKQTTVNFVSVSAATVDRDLQRISAGATGEFKEQFTRGQPQVREAIVENKVESRGSVLRAGLVSGDQRSAVVLVAVDATVKNVRAPDGRASHYRVQVDMARDAESGAWLVSRLQFVG